MLPRIYDLCENILDIFYFVAHIYLLCLEQEAANLGAKVALLDFVKPSERGTTWGRWRGYYESNIKVFFVL